MSRFVMLLGLLGLLAIAAGPAAAQDPFKPEKPEAAKTDLPKGAPPSFLVTRSVNADAAEVVLARVFSFTIPEVTTEKTVVNGEEVTITKTRMRERPQVQDMRYALKDCSVRTAGGKKLGTQDAVKAFKAGAMVLVSGNGKDIDPAYLAALKEDTLVLIAPNTGAAGFGVGIGFPGVIGGPVAPPIGVPAPPAIINPVPLPAPPLPVPPPAIVNPAPVGAPPVVPPAPPVRVPDPKK